MHTTASTNGVIVIVLPPLTKLLIYLLISSRSARTATYWQQRIITHGGAGENGQVCICFRNKSAATKSAATKFTQDLSDIVGERSEPIVCSHLNIAMVRTVTTYMGRRRAQ